MRKATLEIDVKTNDELLRKSKQLSRLTAERFAMIEDRLDKLEEKEFYIPIQHPLTTSNT